MSICFAAITNASIFPVILLSKWSVRSFNEKGRHKYNDKIFQKSLEAFNCLPLAAIVNKQFFCVHGGISPELDLVGDVGKVLAFNRRSTDSESLPQRD
jgi:hypothetical protein